MLDSSLDELQAALAAKRVSSVELTRAFLERIRQLNGVLNAFVAVDEETSLAQARAADERRARGEAGPLTGIPVAHKDIFCTRELPTTCGSRMLAGYRSPYDAHVIEQFARAGAVLLGKTQHGRVRHGLVQRDLLLRAGAQSLGPPARAGGIFGRLGRRRGRATGARRDRHRHRRLHPAAGGADRGLRLEAHLRPGVALRHDRLRLLARPGRAAREKRGGPGAHAQRDDRPRRARFDQPRAPARGLRACAGGAACGPAHRPAGRVLRRGRGAGGARARA